MLKLIFVLYYVDGSCWAIDKASLHMTPRGTHVYNGFGIPMCGKRNDIGKHKMVKDIFERCEQLSLSQVATMHPELVEHLVKQGLIEVGA